MKIKFLGAAGTVTGSSYVLTSGSGQSIMIDMGLFLGTREIDKLNYEPFDYDCGQLSGVILTHAHLDHCGRLPTLLHLGYTGTILMTPATLDLTEISLMDAAKIAIEDNKQHALYDKELARKTIQQFRTFEYHAPIQIGHFSITMRDAGHILGSASIEVVDNRSNSEIRKIVFSGDLGTSPEDLLRETEPIDQADAVVMESTYGDRLHPDSDPIEAIKSEIKSIETSGGTLLIPAFALDRTQELLHVIMHLKKSGAILPQTPVYLDSPLAEKATEIYKKYPKIYNSHIKHDLETSNPFEFPGIINVAKRDESIAIRKVLGPKVIIAGSGMMTGGRILGHAAHYLPIPTTRLFFVGYQGDGTLGRNLIEGHKEAAIEGRIVQVNGSVGETKTMSAHADQKQLLKWLKHIKNVKKIFLTHGDHDARLKLSEKIKEDLQYHDVTLPMMNQEVNF